jgi:phenylalanyl-tRNA synthetase beta chain
LKLSLNWLKDYIDLEGISTDEIISKLTMSGLEVESVIDQNEIYKNIIVGSVKAKAKHPNADKLSLCTISSGSEEFQVICGAPNVEEGQKIVFAKIGAVIPKGNFKINKAKIRGTESFGMICSEAELELSDNHEGIIVLENDAAEGTPISKALNLDDVILEIGITPNRPDALSHIGAARDLAALFRKEIKIPEIILKNSEKNIEEFASIEIEDFENCPRYSSTIICDVTIKESPDWLKTRLKNIGLRPINNIVDVTNYVMYECGQPLHAFDLENLSGHKIIVKSTEEKTKFTTLDSKERDLPADTLMICDAEKPVAIAGVMGGENSEINANTKNILIESAYFKASSVRKTAKHLNLSTEASYRFERGTDPNNTLFAAKRAAQLIAEVAGGKVAEGSLDIYPNKIEAKEIPVRFEKITRLLGYHIPEQKVEEIFKYLGFKILLSSEKELRVKVPTFRPDIEREVDLIEEAARINGYDNIPAVSKIAITLEEKYDESSLSDKAWEVAIALGFSEMITNPLQSEKLSSLIGKKIPILNPLSMDMAYLRTSLIPGALNIAANNIKVGEKDLALFEIGEVFNKNTDGEIESFEHISETKTMIFLLSGKSTNKDWHTEEQNYSFFHLKGFLEEFVNKFSLDNVPEDLYYHGADSIYAYHLMKKIKDNTLLKAGRVSDKVLKQFEIEQDVFAAEINLTELKDFEKLKPQYETPLKYPKITRDFAFIFDDTTSFREVFNHIRNESSKLLKSIKLFDLFESDTLGAGKKSMAFKLEFYDPDRTLTESEVEKEFNHLISAVNKKFNARLRGN